jgi:hypothetical protein
VARKDPARLARVSVSLPFGMGKAEWESDPTERRAAWSLYVELVTRVAIQPLESDAGLASETLSSLHSLFASTRGILQEAGPGVGGSRESVGGIAIAVLNRGLRPFLTKWHPLLQAWEMKRSSGEHEMDWPKAPEMRAELEALQENLKQYAEALATIAGVTEKHGGFHG